MKHWCQAVGAGTNVHNAQQMFTQFKAFYFESGQKAQNTITSYRRQGCSMKKNRGRRGHVKPDTLKRSLDEFSTHFFVTVLHNRLLDTIEVKKGAQPLRWSECRKCVFSTRCESWATKSYCLDIEGMKILKLSQHPQIILQIEVMKTEVITYQTLAGSIMPLVERKDVKGKDTFDMSDWCKTNCAILAAFTYVLRAVLTNSPNS